MDARLDIQALRRVVGNLGAFDQDRSKDRFTLGASRLDMTLGHGLDRRALHEVIPESAADMPAAIGFALCMAMRASEAATARPAGSFAGARRERIVWLRQLHGEREHGKLYPAGLHEMGLQPERLVHLRLRKTTEMLVAAMEVARSRGIGALVLEFDADPAELDLTATRKLTLAAAKNDVPLFCLRRRPRRTGSAAATRWQVRAAPSVALEANAPGAPVFTLSLLRHRGGRDGLSWRLEWNRDERRFAEATLLRRVVSAPADRPAAPGGEETWREAG